MSLQTGARSSEEPARWIAHKAGSFNQAWALQAALDKKKLPPVSERLEKRKWCFLSFVSENQAAVNSEAHEIFQSATSWEDVKKEAEKAVDEYSKHGMSWKSPFARIRRLAVSTASRIEFLTELIPQDDYLGVLCGGLKLMCRAARRNKQLRETIMDTLDTLGVEIEYSKLFIREYAEKSEYLRRCTEDLYIAVLDAVEAVIKWIGKSRHGSFQKVFNAGKALAQQDEYGEDFEKCVRVNVENKVKAFERAIRACLSQQVNNIDNNILTVGNIVQIINGKIDGAIGEVTKAGAAVYTLEEHLAEWLKQLEFNVLSRVEAAFQTQAQLQLRLAVESQQTLQRENSSPAAGPQYLIQPSHVVDLGQLLTALRLSEATSGSDAVDETIDQINAERDLVFYLSSGISPSRRAWIPTLLQDLRFNEWFHSPNSGTLVVKGLDLGVASGELASPWSYVCATLAKTASTMTNFVPIAFFCHLHLDPADRLAGAAGLMRSLIAQLAIQANEGRGTTSRYCSLDPVRLQSAAANDVSSLCTIFDQILNDLAGQGPKVVLCMVDGVSFFETQFHLPRTSQVMQFLGSVVDAVNASRSSLVFKLMITAPGVSEYCPLWFPNSVEITVSGIMTAGSPELGDATMLMGGQSAWSVCI